MNWNTVCVRDYAYVRRKSNIISNLENVASDATTTSCPTSMVHAWGINTFGLFKPQDNIRCLRNDEKKRLNIYECSMSHGLPKCQEVVKTTTKETQEEILVSTMSRIDIRRRQSLLCSTVSQIWSPADSVSPVSPKPSDIKRPNCNEQNYHSRGMVRCTICNAMKSPGDCHQININVMPKWKEKCLLLDVDVSWCKCFRINETEKPTRQMIKFALSHSVCQPTTSSESP